LEAGIALLSPFGTALLSDLIPRLGWLVMASKPVKPDKRLPKRLRDASAGLAHTATSTEKQCRAECIGLASNTQRLVSKVIKVI
jgi:hypothetical protein